MPPSPFPPSPPRVVCGYGVRPRARACVYANVYVCVRMPLLRPPSAIDSPVRRPCKQNGTNDLLPDRCPSQPGPLLAGEREQKKKGKKHVGIPAFSVAPPGTTKPSQSSRSGRARNFPGLGADAREAGVRRHSQVTATHTHTHTHHTRARAQAVTSYTCSTWSALQPPPSGLPSLSGGGSS